MKSFKETTRKQTRTVKGLLRLTRYNDYLVFVTILTFLGVLFSGTALTLSHVSKIFIILFANIFAVGFAFMINDIEDAEDDKLTPSKATRNPVSAGIVSYRAGYAAALGVAFLAGIGFLFTGLIPFILGVVCLLLGLLYSWKLIRLKSIPFLDLVSHSLMLAGLQFTCAYFAFAPTSGLKAEWIFPFIIVVCLSIYGELFNEVRDFEGDKKAGVTHTASLLGIRYAHVLMYVFIGIAGFFLLYAIAIHLIPLWFVAIFVVLSVLLLIEPLLAAKDQKGIHRTGDLQGPVLTVIIISLAIWMLLRILKLL